MRYGSLVNTLYAKEQNRNPKVGDGVTEILWSDRHAYEVVFVADDRHIAIRRYDTKRIDSNGMSDCQDYEYISNPDNRIINLFLTRKGQWRERIGSRSLGSSIFKIGCAEEYYDYSF